MSTDIRTPIRPVQGYGLLLLGVVLMLCGSYWTFRDTLALSQQIRLRLQGRTAMASVQQVHKVESGREARYRISYAFRLENGSRREGTVVWGRGTLHRRFGPGGPQSAGSGQPPSTIQVFYRPADPDYHQLEGERPPWLFGGIVCLLIGVTLAVGGFQTLQLVQLPVLELEVGSSPALPIGQPLALGPVVYRPLVERGELSPSPAHNMTVTILGLLFGPPLAMIVLALLAWGFNTVFGWDLLGVHADDGDPKPEVGLLFLTAAFLLGALLVAVAAMGLHALRFAYQPTVFDFDEGVLRVGGRAKRPLRDLGKISLKFITDPACPGMAKVGLQVVDRDGIPVPLEPSIRAIERRPPRRQESYWDLGLMREGPQVDTVRQVVADISRRAGIDSEEHHQSGSFGNNPKFL